MSPGETADLLKSWAREAGFDRAGVATLEPSAHGGHLRRWLRRGEHAGMGWMGRRVEVRENPADLLPGARSVLCVALHYWPLEGEKAATGDLWPRVARYARGQDYHLVMVDRLRALASRIQDRFDGCGARPYVDTGPILERELAARAGLGAFAKNTHVLDREHGSYFLLGELLLTLELAPDEPLTDVCGRCSRCLDHCPTGALVAPFRLDANRCISYWTIEHRGDLPEPARRMVGDWVFGCDICQEVCPWNVKAPPADHPELGLPAERSEVDLVGLLRMQREEYVRRFRRSPMKRAKLDGLRRNAAVAMGNRGAPRYLPALAEALAGGPADLRRHAAWALGRIGGAGARSVLEAALERETEGSVRREIEAALEAAGGATPRRSPHPSPAQRLVPERGSVREEVQPAPDARRVAAVGGRPGRQRRSGG